MTVCREANTLFSGRLLWRVMENGAEKYGQLDTKMPG